jgi:transcriptional regulator with GAF, ATPase, and Fis domain
MTHPISVPPDTIVHMAQPGAEVYRALFDLSQSIAGHTDMETLCNSLATSLRHVVSFNSLGLMLHDPIHNELRLHAVNTDTAHEHKEIVIPAEGNHAGAWVWREQKPLVLAARERRPVARGVQARARARHSCACPGTAFEWRSPDRHPGIRI